MPPITGAASSSLSPHTCPRSPQRARRPRGARRGAPGADRGVDNVDAVAEALAERGGGGARGGALQRGAHVGLRGGGALEEGGGEVEGEDGAAEGGRVRGRVAVGEQRAPREEVGHLRVARGLRAAREVGAETGVEAGVLDELPQLGHHLGEEMRVPREVHVAKEVPRGQPHAPERCAPVGRAPHLRAGQRGAAKPVELVVHELVEHRVVPVGRRGIHAAQRQLRRRASLRAPVRVRRHARVEAHAHARRERAEARGGGRADQIDQRNVRRGVLGDPLPRPRPRCAAHHLPHLPPAQREPLPHPLPRTAPSSARAAAIPHTKAPTRVQRGPQGVRQREATSPSCSKKAAASASLRNSLWESVTASSVLLSTTHTT